jgi:hypothetical protein
MSNDPCEGWALYRATVFRFSARIGWTEFAIITAANPLGGRQCPKKTTPTTLGFRLSWSREVFSQSGPMDAAPI